MLETYISYEEFFIDELSTIDSMFELYLRIYNFRVDKIDSLNIAPAFFGLAYLSFLYTSITKLSKLYDNDVDTININKFLNIIEQNAKTIFKAEVLAQIAATIKQHRWYLDEYAEQIKKLKTIRDKYLAHNDKKIIVGKMDIWKLAGLSIGEIRQLIRLASSMVNAYKVFRIDIYSDIEAIGRFDVDNVIDAIEFYRKE